MESFGTCSIRHFPYCFIIEQWYIRLKNCYTCFPFTQLYQDSTFFFLECPNWYIFFCVTFVLPCGIWASSSSGGPWYAQGAGRRGRSAPAAAAQHRAGQRAAGAVNPWVEGFLDVWRHCEMLDVLRMFETCVKVLNFLFGSQKRSF